jgi:hypothetical protein
MDELVLGNITDFLWHSKRIESHLGKLVQSLMENHDSPPASAITPQALWNSANSTRGYRTSGFDLLEWLLKKKSELEGEPEAEEVSRSIQERT